MRDKSEIMDALGRRIDEELGTGPDEQRYRSQRKAVAMLAGQDRPTRSRALVAVPIAASIVLAVIGATYLLLRDEPMAFWVGQELAAGSEGAWIEAPAGQTRAVRFEDGSRVECAGGALIRVVRSRSDEVAVSLDHGEILASVSEEADARWTIEAGPYQVKVTGTVFSVQWEPGGLSLEVGVDRGEVRVQGPGLDGRGTTLHAGDFLHMDKRERVMAGIPAARGEQPVRQESPREAGVAAVEPPDVALPEKKPAPRESLPKWKSLSAAGKYKEAMDAASGAGFDQLLATLGQADLWELATAARYARRGPETVAALEAFRQRFPGSTKAATAAFLLGRVQVELNKKPGRAAKWFRTYLEESPDGQLAEEALGRLIDAYLKAGNDKAAAKAAQSYLDKHGDGVFKELATSVLEK